MTFSAGKKSENIPFLISVAHVKKRWKNIKDYEKSRQKNPPKRAKKPTGKGRTSDDDEYGSDDYDGDSNEDEDDDEDKENEVDTSFLNEIPSRRSTITNIETDDYSFVENLEIHTTDGDSLTGLIISQKGDTIASEGNQTIDMISKGTSSQPSLFSVTPKPDKRRKPPKDDAYIEVMREKTQALKELASTSTALNVAYHGRESKEKTIMQQYFEVFAAEIALLPVEMQPKCQREIHQAVSGIIYKYQDMAEEMKNAKK